MKTFIDLFLATAEAYKNSPAVEDRNASYTYEELRHLSAAVAQKLRQIARMQRISIAHAEEAPLRVALLLPRTRDFYVAMLGILRGGYTYVPIDSEYPTERIASIMKDAGCTALITTEALWREKQLAAEKLLFPDAALFLEELEKIRVLDVNINHSGANKEAVLLFTSGSTGKPKGGRTRRAYPKCFLSAAFDTLSGDA